MQELLTIQQQLKVAKDKQGDKGKFNYRTAEGILNAVKPILADVKCTIILTDVVWESNNGIFFMKSTATLWSMQGKVAEAEGFAQLDDHIYEKNGQKIIGMSKEQATGSASSYARKYALCGLFAIDDGSQDPDSIEKPLATRIALAQNANDINLLMAEINAASEEDKKSFNAQVANLLLVFDKSSGKFVPAQKQ